MKHSDAQIVESLSSKSWRLNHLYRIIDKNGDSIPFKLNDVQQDVLDNIHPRSIILKARQLGMSTFSVLYLLDEAIFVPNTSAGIVSYSLEHAQHILKKIIGHALDTLSQVTKTFLHITARSAREIVFANGSFLRVDTTLRGASYQIVLVSEFGKTCARNPLKAEEIITGTLQTVPSTGRVLIESTGEGNSGFYAEMVNAAHIRGNANLSPLDYKLFFFPWYRDTQYRLQEKIDIDVELTDYFNKIEKDNNITFTQQQKNWYAKQQLLLGDKIKQEYPSSISEAFLASSDAFYFQSGIEKAYSENRCLATNPYDALEPVYVSMDIGVNDLTVLLFFQVVHGEIRIIDYYSANNKGIDHYAFHLQKDKQYLYHTIFLPHDARKRDGLIVENTYEREFRKLFANTETHFIVLKQTDKSIQISNAKQKLDRCVFNLPRTKKLLDQLCKYRKKWSEQYGRYLDQPYHDISSNYADAFLYACQAVNHIETVSGRSKAFERHKEVVAARSKIF